jgi:uncharacterized protein (TIGR02594 family)
MRHEVNVDALNVRSGPGTNFEVLDVIGRRTIDEIDASGWCPIPMEDGSIGWVARKYLVPAPAAPVQPETPPQTSLPPWYAIALQELQRGVEEVPGGQDNPRIVEYHSTTTLKATDDETPWCSSFVNWCMWKAGIKGTRDARAISWLDWGKEVPFIRDQVRMGDVIVFEWTNAHGEVTGHHVAFFQKSLGSRLQVIGGNQSDRVTETVYPWGAVMGIRRPA